MTLLFAERSDRGREGLFDRGSRFLLKTDGFQKPSMEEIQPLISALGEPQNGRNLGLDIRPVDGDSDPA